MDVRGDFTSASLFTVNIGMKESIQVRKITGPIIFSHFFAPKVKVGILNKPKSAPEKYGANKRMKEKLSSTTPNGSGRPDNLKRLDLSITLYPF